MLRPAKQIPSTPLCSMKCKLTLSDTSFIDIRIVLMSFANVLKNYVAAVGTA